MGSWGVSMKGAILAGGKSHRMGRDKALVEVDGSTLLGVGYRALVEAGVSQPIVVGGDGDAYRGVITDLVTVDDDHPGEGPLGGIITALRRVPPGDEVIVILACDLSGVCAESVLAVARALDLQPRAQVAVVRHHGHLEPLHSAWRRSALLDLEAVFAKGVRAVHEALDILEVTVVTGLKDAWLKNVNTQRDLP